MQTARELLLVRPLAHDTGGAGRNGLQKSVGNSEAIDATAVVVIIIHHSTGAMLPAIVGGSGLQRVVSVSDAGCGLLGPLMDGLSPVYCLGLFIPRARSLQPSEHYNLCCSCAAIFLPVAGRSIRQLICHSLQFATGRYAPALLPGAQLPGNNPRFRDQARLPDASYN
jgi:hypothetical protein